MSEFWELVWLTKGHHLKCYCDKCEKLRQLKRLIAANKASIPPLPTNTVASSRVSTEASNDPGMQQSASVPVVAEELAQNFRYRFPSDPSSEEAKPSTSGSRPSEEQGKAAELKQLNAASAASKIPPPSNTVASSRVSTEASNDLNELVDEYFGYQLPSDQSSEEEAKPSTSGSKPSEEQAEAAELKQSNAASAASKTPPPSNTVASSRVSTETLNDLGMQQSVYIPVKETYKPLDEIIAEELARNFDYWFPSDPSSEEAKPSTSGSKPSEEQAEAAELQQSNAASAASKTPPPSNTVASSRVSAETLNDLGMQQSVYETYNPLHELVAVHLFYQSLSDLSSEEEDKPSTSGNKPSEEQAEAAGWEVLEQKEYDPPKEEFCNLSDLEDALNDVDEVEEDRDSLDFDFPDPNPTHSRNL